MPVTTPQQKIDKTRAFGGGAGRDPAGRRLFRRDAARRRRRFAAEAGALFLPPFDDADVIEGQASSRLEILEQLPAPPDLVVVPVGGGGLSAGIVQVADGAGARHGVPPRRAGRGAEPAARARGGRLVTLREGRQLRRRRGGGAGRRPQLRGAGPLRPGRRGARARGPDLRDDGRDAQHRGGGARAGRGARDRRAARPRTARGPHGGRRSSRAATSTSSGCPT